MSVKRHNKPFKWAKRSFKKLLSPTKSKHTDAAEVLSEHDTEKTAIGVAARFAETLLRKLPDCLDGNPVKVAFSIARVIIQVKDGVEDNKSTLRQNLQILSQRLLVVEGAIMDGIPKGSEQAIEGLKQALGQEMILLETLRQQSLLTRIFDYEHHTSEIQAIFLRMQEAVTVFQMSMMISIQSTASQIHDHIKDEALQRLQPSDRADFENVLEEHAPMRDQCTDGTRVDILREIMTWAHSPLPDSPPVFWLTGPAGAGKTTIAATVSKRIASGDSLGEEHVTLGGNFFCSRHFPETRAAARIIPTIAFHLARNCKPYADALLVADKLNAMKHAVPKQLKSLIVAPWLQCEGLRGKSDKSYLIVIEALDELAGVSGTEFLDELLSELTSSNLRGLKFLITSRSDPDIIRTMETFPPRREYWLQRVSPTEASSDIMTYLKAHLPNLPDDDLVKLEMNAEGLFIYAATAVKFLTPHRHIQASEQGELLHQLLSYSADSHGPSTHFLIDSLYQHIMRDAFSGFRGSQLTRRLSILFTILSTGERLPPGTISAILGGCDGEIVQSVVRSLHAVIYYQNGSILWYHASFPDFIFDSSRSNFCLEGVNYAFSCDLASQQDLLLDRCFRCLESSLTFNIGNIPSSFDLDAQEYVIAPVIVYSASNWHQHLTSKSDFAGVSVRISNFLQVRVLFWIEVMNLLQKVSSCAIILGHARHWAQQYPESKQLATDLGTALNFAYHFAGSAAAKSTPHLYISALSSWTSKDPLSQHWKAQFPKLPSLTHTGSHDTQCIWRAGEAPVLSHRVQPNLHMNEVACIAVSADGRHIVSCNSKDATVYIWDALNGEALSTLTGHDDAVTSLAISRDGNKIVSGSKDETVRIWDYTTCRGLHILRGHTSSVSGVAVALSGTWLASGSQDSTIRVWDMETGAEKIALYHRDPVMSVAVSTYDTRVVCATGDTIIAYDVATGQEIWRCTNRPTLRHDRSGATRREFIYYMAISQDGTRVATNSKLGPPRIWDTAISNDAVVLRGASRGDSALAISNDGSIVVSGCPDALIRVWDIVNGKELLVLKGHTSRVTSVAISEDRTCVVSGSTDGTIRIWDISGKKKVVLLRPTSKFPEGVPKNANGIFDWRLTNRHPLTSDGLIVSADGNQRLMYVWPSAEITDPANIVVIGGDFGSIDFTQCVDILGKNWTDCYRPVEV